MNNQMQEINKTEEIEFAGREERMEQIKAEKKKTKELKRTWFFGGIVAGLVLSILISCGTYLVNVLRNGGEARLVINNPEATEADKSVMNSTVENKIRLLEDSIKEYYLSDVSNEDLEIGLYRGIVQALDDPYSEYYTVEELKELQESTEGIYYGIGAYVGFDTEKNYCKITGIIEGTPAQESGLQAEDIIVEVDGEDTMGMTTTDVVALIKGKENTDVVLTIYREGELDYLEITVTRRQVEAPTVNYEMLEDGIAYIQITQFEAVSGDQFREKLAQARDEDMKGLIIDLRNNPGGTLSSVVDISRQILPEGLIVYTEDKNGERDEYRCEGKNQLEVPLVVLVNENSASASEIFAGAVKDYGIGTLVGTTTFGKGIVQKVYSITDGSAIKLTVSHYYTPNGNDIHGVGVEPDEVLELDREKYAEDGSDNQLKRAQEILAGELK